MIYLSDDAIKYAFADCVAQSNYKVLIVVRDKITRMSVIEIIEQYVKTYKQENFVLSAYSDGFYNCIVKFTNGSMILLVRHSEANRGRKCNLLIMDSDIDKETIKHTYRNVETKRY